MGDLPDRPYAAGAVDWRTTGTGARILADLGVRKLKVLGAQKKYIALSGFDLEVAEHVG
jgi:3,4-dihydroxy 2-butanone 4-phosphate synthase/GTP cyclohydrolase II